MILAFDIGNTHLIPVFFNDKGDILLKFRIPTNLSFTEDTLYVMLKTLCDENNINLKDVNNIIISSVVPHVNEIFEYLAKDYFKITPTFVSLDTIKHGIILNENTERGLGADRIIDILQSFYLYPNKELIIIDFGTATTFDIISRQKEYLGGCIIPGIELSLRALFEKTAALPKVKFKKPDTVMGRTTISQINIGLYYGNIGIIKELITEYKKQLENPIVISTGGQGREISKDVDLIDHYVPNLSLDGLFRVYELTKL